MQINQLQEDKKEDSAKMVRIEKVQTEHSVEMAKLKDDNAFCMRKISQLTSVVSHQKQVIRELSTKLDIVEKDKVNSNLIIQGIEEKYQENCVQVAKGFFKDIMKIKTQISIKFS